MILDQTQVQLGLLFFISVVPIQSIVLLPGLYGGSTPFESVLLLPHTMSAIYGSVLGTQLQCLLGGNILYAKKEPDALFFCLASDKQCSDVRCGDDLLLAVRTSKL